MFLSLVLNVLRVAQLQGFWTRLFQTTGAHTLKTWLDNAVLVDDTATSIRVANRNDIQVPKVRAEIWSPR